jgi:cysteine desulfurase/selenocysteine lyase
LAGGFSGREAADSLALEAAPDPSRSPPSEPPAYWGSPGAIWDDGAKVLKAALSLLPSAADLLEAKTPASLPLGGPRLVASPVVVSESAQEPAGAHGARASSLKDPSSRPKGISGLKPPPYVGPFSVEDIRRDFPILSERLRGGRPLAWLDNAATTQKPRAVIERLSSFYSHENSNVHRGAHELAERATDAYEGAREAVARFIGAKGPENIVFTRGTTEGLNLVARAFAAPRIGPGDEIVLTVLEHHANIVPWQLLAQEAGAKLAIAPVDGDGQIILSEYAALFGPRTKFASVAHVSNALGTVTPLAELVAIAKAAGVPIAVDAAQSVSHLPLNVTALGADFLVFSGHKIYGPTGVGVVYGTLEALEEARPYQGGGNMIADVTFERTVYQPPPKKFEAGTQNIAGAVGLAAALDYLSRLGLANVAAYEEALLSYGESLLRAVPGLRLIGTAKAKASVSSFVIEGKSLEAVAAHLSRAGIAVRAGHHCAQPILRSFGLEGTVRPSIAFYNTPEELELLADLLWDLASK